MLTAPLRLKSKQLHAHTESEIGVMYRLESAFLLIPEKTTSSGAGADIMMTKHSRHSHVPSKPFNTAERSSHFF